MDHSAHIPLNDAELTNDVLSGAPVYGFQDEKIGTISHMHVGSGATAVAVDVGGFLGIGTRSVLLKLDEIRLMRDESGTVHGAGDWTKDQLQELPEHHD